MQTNNKQINSMTSCGLDDYGAIDRTPTSEAHPNSCPVGVAVEPSADLHEILKLRMRGIYLNSKYTHLLAHSFTFTF
jgi:hypothetical protein